jgi:hypothetical protein
LQVIANNQQTLSQRLIALEQNATNQLTNLNKQFNSLRLTHTKERKEIEYNPNKLTDQKTTNLMSFLPDLTPLIQQIKEFNQNQVKTNQLLTEILEIIKKK